MVIQRVHAFKCAFSPHHFIRVLLRLPKSHKKPVRVRTRLLTLLVAGSWLPLLVARGGCLGPPLDISGSYRSIFKIQTAFVSPQHDLHF